MRTRCFFVTIVFILLFPEGLFAAQANITEDQRMIKTYPFSEPDTVPTMTRSNMRMSMSRIYPYFSFDKFSYSGSEQSWKVVRMENPYIKVEVLPEVGGKVYGATEKSTGNEFIYLNHVLKFREIALRGPWTSGGIEFNFGLIGHTATTATPVDYLVRKNDDGSVSCIVGAMDLPSRSRWSVDITLPPDKAYFETKAFCYNPSPLNQSYYAWMNAAVKTGMDLQYIYPGRYYAPHGYSIQKELWPIDKQGRDISWYKNNNFGTSKSYFIVGEYENFCGGYWHNSDFGFGHWSLYDDIPGKKVWIWALSRQGGIWEELLTDSDGQYSEPQIGRLFKQDDHEFFAPYTTDLWRELWFPYKDIGPMSKATPHATLNLSRKGEFWEIGVCALQKINDDIVVTEDDKEIYREHLTLEPMDVYRKTIERAVDKQKLRVCIGDKLCYSGNAGANDINRPISFHGFDETTAEGLYLTAERLEKKRNYGAALNKYLATLEAEPLHSRALSRIAELYYRKGEYKKALSYAAKALKNVMYDADANYIYGVICRHLGNTVDAKETLGWAARSMKYRSAAYCQLAEICLLENNIDLALEYAQRSRDFNKYNIQAYEVTATIYRKAGNPDKAMAMLQELLEIDPLNHLARFEIYLSKPNKKNLDTFTSMIRNELPHENYIEMALYYVKLGLEKDAVQVLKIAPEYPTCYYWLAYLLKDKSPRESQRYLQKAGEIDPALVFPFRRESIPVFEWAINEEPQNWKPKYYLGLIYWGKGKLQETRNLFADCNTADFASFYISRGYLYKQTDLRKARSDYEKALSINRTNWKNWHHLIGLYEEMDIPDKALALSRRARDAFPDEMVIEMDLVRVLLTNKQYSPALKILNNARILPYEGARGVHGMFVHSQVHLAIESMRKADYAKAIKFLEDSRAFPERLGTGKSHNPDYRLQNYLEAVCYAKINNTAKADEIKKNIYDYTLENWPSGHWRDRYKYHYLGSLILEETGRTEKAKELLDELKLHSPNNKIIQWFNAHSENDEKRTMEIETQLKNNQKFRVIKEMLTVIEELTSENN